MAHVCDTSHCGHSKMEFSSLLRHDFGSRVPEVGSGVELINRVFHFVII